MTLIFGSRPLLGPDLGVFKGFEGHFSTNLALSAEKLIGSL